jgi:hypothetical protein
MNPQSTDDQLDEELDGTFPASDPPGLTQPSGAARRPGGGEMQPQMEEAPSQWRGRGPPGKPGR